MGTPYIGEIRLFAGSFAPQAWKFCEGELLRIADFEELFQVIGTTYGGDGQETYALPDLRGRIPVHQGNGSVLAETGGVEQVTLTTQQMPVHSHTFLAASNQASSFAPAGQVPAITQLATTTPYGTDNPVVNLHPNSVTTVGGSQPHDNFQPYLCVNFIIALYGVYPTQ